MTVRKRPTFAPTVPKADIPPETEPINSDTPSEPPLSLVSMWNHEFALEFAMAMDGFTISVERAGGVMRVKGDAVVRSGPKVTRVPLTLVLRFEDAAALGPGLTGKLREGDQET